jgi:CHASE1-domain containing sensor protein
MTTAGDNEYRAALEQLADSVLSAVEQVVDPGGERLESAVKSLRRTSVASRRAFAA